MEKEQAIEMIRMTAATRLQIAASNIHHGLDCDFEAAAAAFNLVRQVNQLSETEEPTSDQADAFIATAKKMGLPQNTIQFVSAVETITGWRWPVNGDKVSELQVVATASEG